MNNLIKNSFNQSVETLKGNRFSLKFFSFSFTIFRTFFFIFIFGLALTEELLSNFIESFLIITLFFLTLLFFYKLIWNISIKDKENKIKRKLISSLHIKTSSFLGLFTVLIIAYSIIIGFHPVICLILIMFLESFCFSILTSNSNKFFNSIKNYFYLIKNNFLKIFLFELIFLLYNYILFFIFKDIYFPALFFFFFSIFISPFRNVFSTQFYINIIEENYDNNEINDI